MGYKALAALVLIAALAGIWQWDKARTFQAGKDAQKAEQQAAADKLLKEENTKIKARLNNALVATKTKEQERLQAIAKANELRNLLDNRPSYVPEIIDNNDCVNLGPGFKLMWDDLGREYREGIRILSE